MLGYSHHFLILLILSLVPSSIYEIECVLRGMGEEVGLGEWEYEYIV